jgi:hypothetical protein
MTTLLIARRSTPAAGTPGLMTLRPVSLTVRPSLRARPTTYTGAPSPTTLMSQANGQDDQREWIDDDDGQDNDADQG